MKFCHACAVLLLLALPLTARAQESVPPPEAGSGTVAKALVAAERHMVVAAHPLAAQAGREILRQGGSAADAAIAVQLVLGLVEPQSSGLGGGAFIVTWDEAAKSVVTIDGRETAPASATADRFLKDGKPMDFDEAVRSGLSVGTPGAVRGLEALHKKFGKLPWSALFTPAIKLARDGFPVGARLNALLRLEGAERFPVKAREYFFDGEGNPRAAGAVIRNPDYAASLEDIASHGAAAFYQGRIADEMIAAVGAAPFAKGDLTREDLSSYAAKERAPVCFTYRVRKICGMGPPSSGTLTIAQTLKIIEPLGGVSGMNARMTAGALHLIGEAEKLAFADRNRYLADPDFVTIPSGLLDDGYLAERRNLVNRARAMEKPAAGVPPGMAKRTYGDDATAERAGTSHISIVDDAGNAVAMTTTIESAFGSHMMAAGFLLNNELTDFSLRPVDKNGVAAANRVEGGKRPRSSMAPLIVFDAGGNLEVVTGSPGGSRIILFMVKTLVALIDWNMAADEAAALANFGSEGGAFQIEAGTPAFWLDVSLKSMGHQVGHEVMTSGVHTIVKRSGRLEGGADPRREGVALGD
ncbi:MAG: gamma-glutamyltransferase [Hyphomicrobium sp.]